jgi:multidrug efflux pump subunit AcrB
VFSTLQVYLGSQYVNDFNYLGRTYQVIAQADGGFRRDPQDIARLKARNTSGEMVPFGTVARLKYENVPYRVPRYNLFPAAVTEWRPWQLHRAQLQDQNRVTGLPNAG